MIFKSKYFSVLFLLLACHQKQSNDDSLVVPIDPSKVVVVNSTDENGKKQGRWEEMDTIHHRITKEYYYKDDLLDSSYLVYKVSSSDTLVFGFYKLGKKQGAWKIWETSSNRIDRIETYENDVLKKTQKQ